jgi:hypothetical protein
VVSEQPLVAGSLPFAHWGCIRENGVVAFSGMETGSCSILLSD